MCTVTFIASQHGYALGMNRDEQRSRVSGQPPDLHGVGRGRALFPAEPGGGTWMGVNGVGVTFALLNWYRVPPRGTWLRTSRGQAVRSALGLEAPGAVSDALQDAGLLRMHPFRLVGIFPRPRQVWEWRWNQDQLESREHAWRTRTWVSSGRDEAGAQRIRGEAFRRALSRPDAGSLGWMRRLHRSHWPEPGPYSHCMHRPDAATVSYTEVLVASETAIMRGTTEAPCRGTLGPALTLPLICRTDACAMS